MIRFGEENDKGRVQRGGEGMEGQRKGCGAGDLKAEENLREENTKYFFKKINIWVIASPRGQGLPTSLKISSTHTSHTPR